MARILDDLWKRILEKILQNSRILNENLQQIAEGMEKRVDPIESKIGELNKKILSVDGKIMVHGYKFLLIKKKCQDGKLKVVRVIEGSKTRPPVFDGSTSFDVFQFETIEICG